MCLGAAYWSRLTAVYYAAASQDAAAAGFDDAFIYRELQHPAAARRLPMRQLPLPDATAPFRAWQASPERIEY